MDFHSIVGKLRAIETLGMHNRSIEEDTSCNMTAEGESCPMHGLEECPGYTAAPLEEGPDRDGEYFSNADTMAGTQAQDTEAIPQPIASPPGVEEDSKPKLSSEFLSKLSGDLSELAKMIEAAQVDETHMEEEAPADQSTLEEASGDIDDIIKMHQDSVERFANSGDMDEDLFQSLYSYYFDEMPYGTKKARTGDPMEWVSERFYNDLRHMGMIDELEEEAPLGPMPFTPLGATNNGPDQQGFVVTGGTNVNYFESKQDSLMEGLTITTSRDTRDGKVTKTLNISATDEDAEQLAHLLRNAGMGMQVASQASQNPPAQVMQAMENADHDVGHDPKSEVGEPLNVQDYIWDGPHINQRFGKIGDNTLMSERRETIFKALSEEYDSFLAEAELPPASVGSQSPLTATSRDAFDKDPFTGEKAVDDGSHSPLSTVKRQDVMN